MHFPPIQEFELEYFQKRENYMFEKKVYKNAKVELKCNLTQNVNKKNISRVMNGLSLRLETTKVF